MAYSTLTANDVRRIRTMYKEGMLQKNIARLFGISRESVGLIVQRRRWAHVPCDESAEDAA
jgi:DNA-binding transcriptional regulator LsrR (DeoR family)